MCHRARLHQICTSRGKVQTFLIFVANCNYSIFIAEIKELSELFVEGMTIVASTAMPAGFNGTSLELCSLCHWQYTLCPHITIKRLLSEAW